MDKFKQLFKPGFALFIPSLVLLLFAVTLNPPPVPSPDSAPDLPGGVTTDWWTAAQKHLAQREYNTTKDNNTWQAPNRAQNLRFRFPEGGVKVEPRRGTSYQWDWTWRTVAFGRTDRLQPVSSAQAHASLNKVNYPRDQFLEWYLNSPEGLEQGFDLPYAPTGDGPLCIEAEIQSNLHPQQKPNHNHISYLDDQGAALLTYSKLLAFDATGRELPGEMYLTEGGIRLLIDDSNAIYPLTIDPLLSTPDWVKESDRTDAEFGMSVCTAGDVNGDGFSDVIVGAPGYDEYEAGWAFVYHGSASGLHLAPDWDWNHYNYDARFGSSVAGLGDVNGDGFDDVAIGAPQYGSGHTGEVRVFHGSADGLADVSSFIKQGDSSVDAFGTVVAAAGDINGDGYNDLAVKGDGVFVFFGSDTGVRTYGYWHEDDSGSFGAAIAGAGDVNADGYDDLLVGSPNWDTYSHDNAGRAQLFLGTADGPEHTATWTSTGGVNLIYLGTAVSSAGDMNGDGYADFLVSAPQSNGIHGHYVSCYYGSEAGPISGWSTTGDHVSPRFGTALAPAGDINGDGYADVIIASDNYTDGTDYLGRADVYYGGLTAPGEEPDWSAVGEQDFEHFGCSVGPAGDINGDGFSDIIIGAKDWSNPQVSEGRAVVYQGSPTSLTALPNWVIESNQENALFGSSVACLGDVNGDGYSDVLVGASYYDNGQVNEGAAFLYLGTQNGLAIVPFWFCESNQANALMGFCVAAAGDVNGDGFPDGLVSAPYFDGVDNYEGRAYLWHSAPGGAPFGTPDNADWVGSYPQESAFFGYSLATAGDVNGDGFADVIVGAPYYDQGTTNEGLALVYHGSATGLSSDPDWVHDTNHLGAFYGSSVASAGDFNGDGFSDVIVGAPGYDHPEVDEGLAFVYLGSSDGIQAGAPFWYAQSDQPGAGLGMAVASTGDVAGDGFSGVMVGAEWYNGTVTDGGAVFAWRGGPSAPSPALPDDAYWSMLGSQDSGLESLELAPAGDINSDGYGDIIIGLPYYDTAAGENAGGILVYFGGSDGLVEGLADGWVLGDQSYAYLGKAVSAAGDVNGDGFDDLVMSAFLYDYGQPDEGRVYVYYGTGPNGLVRKVKQMRTDFSGPIGLAGLSDSNTGFGLDVMARSAGGRGRVRLEWEADQFADAFASPTRGFSDWYDTGVPDGALGSRTIVQTLIEDLEAGTQYCWRVRIRTDDPAFAASPWLNLPTASLTTATVRTTGGASAIGEDETPQLAVGRLSNYPNPFNPSTTFSFALDTKQQVQLWVYDLAGRRVATVHDGPLDAGDHNLTWRSDDDSGRSLASGVYFAKLATGEDVSVRKITLAK